MKHANRRIGYRIAPTVFFALAALATAWLPQHASAADETPRRANVLCVVDKDSVVPFPAGKNLCFKGLTIKGKTSVPAYKSAAVCAYDAAAAAQGLDFVFSVLPKAACVWGHVPVTKKEDYRWGLDMLSAEEKAFILEHVQAQ
jgi:hypothetical protein